MRSTIYVAIYVAIYANYFDVKLQGAMVEKHQTGLMSRRQVEKHCAILVLCILQKQCPGVKVNCKNGNATIF